MTTIFLVIHDHDYSGVAVIGASSTKEKAEKLAKRHQTDSISETKIKELVLDDEVDRVEKGQRVYRVEYDTVDSQEPRSILLRRDADHAETCYKTTKGAFVAYPWAVGFNDARNQASRLRLQYVTDREQE